MVEKNKDLELQYSADGVNYKPLKPFLDELSIVSADLAEGDDICWTGECSGIIKLKKRHQSRKWKKKHGLLRRQHRRLFKDFGKALYKIIRVARKTGESISKLGEVFLKSGLGRPIDEVDQYALYDALYTADLMYSNEEATDDEKD